MSADQQNLLQLTLFLVLIVILFPPSSSAHNHEFLFSLPAFSKIDSINLILRIAAVGLAGTLICLNAGMSKEEQVINLEWASLKTTAAEYFHGKKPLGKTFFLVGVLGISTLYFFTYHVFGPNSLQNMYGSQSEIALAEQETASPTFIVSLVCLTIYTIGALVAIWNSASNHKGLLLKICIKTLVLLGALNAIGIATVTLQWFLGI